MTLDIRLFKFLILVVVEGLLGAAYFVLFRYFFDTRFGSFFYYILHYALISFPVLILLPEDNWIWLVEEDPRGRKITLRSKASKHLHLSMFYIFIIGYPCLLASLALFTKWEKYRFPPSLILIGYGFVFGAYCAWRNYRNVLKYDALFAVGWDRKSMFLEIFVGLKVARKMKFFYKGFGMIAGFALLAGSLAAAPVYYKYFEPMSEAHDREKFMVMQIVYCIMLALSVWAVSMYVVFQAFFSRKLEAWVREKRR